MSDDFFKTAIIKPIVDWIAQEFPDTPAIVLRQNTERPSVDYFGLEMVAPLNRPGFSDDVIHKTGTETTFEICGQRSFTISISAYLVKNDSNRTVHDDVFTPHWMLKKVQDMVDDPGKMEVLAAAGLAVWDAGDILDIPEAVETGFESRAQMDIVMGIAANRETDLGAIESTVFTGTVDGEEEPPITVEDA